MDYDYRQNEQQLPQNDESRRQQIPSSVDAPPMYNPSRDSKSRPQNRYVAPQMDNQARNGYSQAEAGQQKEERKTTNDRVHPAVHNMDEQRQARRSLDSNERTPSKEESGHQNRGNNEQNTIERRVNETRIKASTLTQSFCEVPTPLDDNLSQSTSSRRHNQLWRAGTPAMGEYRDLDQSVSSVQMTNYEDSEFMIQAYKRKKAQADKYKRRCLKAESDLHVAN